MLQTNSPIDPITQILILAYRRGLLVRQQQAEQNKNKTARPENFAEDTGQAVKKQPTPEGVSRDQV